MAIFERTDEKGLAAARAVFGKEPTDPELYEYITEYYAKLRFSEPHSFSLIIKRKNPKRILREVRREMEKAKVGTTKESYAQEVLRLELEKNKQAQKSLTKVQKEQMAQEKFQQRQAKKKKKERGH